MGVLAPGPARYDQNHNGDINHLGVWVVGGRRLHLETKKGNNNPLLLLLDFSVSLQVDRAK